MAKIGREYDERHWMAICDCGTVDVLINYLNASISKWKGVQEALKEEKESFTHEEREAFINITQVCGVCIAFDCDDCPLNVDGERCFERGDYKYIYESRAEFDTFFNPLSKWAVENREVILRYAGELISYLQGLVAHIKGEK